MCNLLLHCFSEGFNYNKMPIVYLLTVELITELTGWKKTKAYEIITAVNEFANQGDDYNSNVYDWADFEGWDVDRFMFSLLATREEAVDYFANEIKLKTKTIVLDGKYGGNAILTIDTDEVEIIVEKDFNKLEVTNKGEIEATEKKIIVKVKKKKGI